VKNLMEDKTLVVKVLGFRSPGRYAVRRLVLAAWDDLSESYPNYSMNLAEIKLAAQISRYSTNFVLPSLVVDEELVCAGRVPTRAEVIVWLEEAIESKCDRQRLNGAG
jgi:hypothetical protein